jgi:hypothetical protein
MSFGDWWRRKSGGAKTVVVLAALLILQIGLCFGSGFAVDRLVAPTPGEEFGPSLGWMFIQAELCLPTAAALLIVVVVLGVSRGIKSARGSSGKENND